MATAQYTRDDTNFNMPVVSGLDLTNTTSYELVLQKPSGTVVTRSLNLTDILDRVSGTVNIPIIDGDLDEEGIYDIQIKDTSSVLVLSSAEGHFYVTNPVE